MKNIYSLIFVLLVLISGCKTTKTVTEKRPEVISNPVAVADSNLPATYFSGQTTWLLGYFNLSQLTSYPYSTWYLKGFDDYQFNTDAINKLLDINKENLSIKIVMGTWCPDSRKQVPHFMKVLDIWQFPITKVTFIGVDDSKVSPVGEYSSLDIKRVPTFIIYRNNIENGRIIENPVTSLEQDLVNILTGKNNNK